jgi:DNA repair exonuclease SbcCD ATPase subunit
MKLTLKNFRCYNDQTFEFDDDTITLINGPSGRGKTTILIGIQFALYGSSTQKHLISHNKNNCEVNLVYKNFKIKRTKRPNILNLEFNGQLYEDKEAQVVINTYFGAVNSSIFFMDLSHLEKMEYLEKIVNGECNVKDLKMKIKTEIADLSKRLAVLDGQIVNTESILEMIEKPNKVEKPSTPSPNLHLWKGKDKEMLSREELLSNKEEVTKKLEQKQIDKVKYASLVAETNLIIREIHSLGSLNPLTYEQIKKLSKKLVSLKAENNQWNKLREDFLIAEESLKELKNYEQYNDNDYNSIKQEIHMLDQQIQQCEKFTEFQTFKKMENEYTEALNQEMSEWQQKVTLVQDQLNELGECDSEQLSILEHEYNMCKDARTFNSRHDLEEIDEQIETLKSRFFKSYKCTNCNHKIIINMDTFEMVMPPMTMSSGEPSGRHVELDDLKDHLKQLTSLKDKIEHNLQLVRNMDMTRLEDKIRFIKSYNKLSQELEQLGSFRPSTLLSKMNKKISCLKLTLPENIPEVEGDVNILKDAKRDLSIQANNISQLLKVKNNLLKKITKLETYDEVKHTTVKQSIEDCEEALKEKYVELEKLKTKQRLDDKLEQLKEQVDDLNFDEEAVPCLEHALEDIYAGLDYHQRYDDYKNFQIQLKKYKNVKLTLSTFKTNKKNLEATYLKMLLLKQKVIEAEHESLRFMINVINTHLSVLLQDFFSESFGDPIEIYLELVNETKPQINTVIHYKGNVVDYKSLSTGEYARVKLAFDLTFKEILGENIIMLDECTANLDQDLSTKIFNKIKDTFPSKTLLVVAHQVITGTFDRIVTVGQH